MLLTSKCFNSPFKSTKTFLKIVRSFHLKYVRSLMFLLSIPLLSGQFITFGNIVYVFLFGWWVSLAHLLVGTLMFMTIIGIPHGKSSRGRWCLMFLLSVCFTLVFSLILQVSCAGDCADTCCGHLAALFTRYLLGVSIFLLSQLERLGQ